MKNSSHMVFSVIRNFESYMKGKIEPADLFKLVFVKTYTKSKNYFQYNCKRIYNDIENNYYNYIDLVIAISYICFFEKNIDLNKVKVKEILEIKKLYTEEQLNKDKELLINVNKVLKLNNFNEFLTVNSLGFPLIFEYIENKIISPAIFVRLLNIFLTLPKEDDILLENKFEIFLRISQLQKYILTNNIQEDS